MTFTVDIPELSPGLWVLLGLGLFYFLMLFVVRAMRLPKDFSDEAPAAWLAWLLSPLWVPLFLTIAPVVLTVYFLICFLSPEKEQGK